MNHEEFIDDNFGFIEQDHGTIYPNGDG